MARQKALRLGVPVPVNVPEPLYPPPVLTTPARPRPCRPSRSWHLYALFLERQFRGWQLAHERRVDELNNLLIGNDCLNDPLYVPTFWPHRWTHSGQLIPIGNPENQLGDAARAGEINNTNGALTPFPIHWSAYAPIRRLSFRFPVRAVPITPAAHATYVPWILVQPPERIQRRLKRLRRYYKTDCGINFDGPHAPGPFGDQRHPALLEQAELQLMALEQRADGPLAKEKETA